jgi:hypothetical protein
MPVVNVSDIKGKKQSWSNILFTTIAPETPFKSKVVLGPSIDQLTHQYKVKQHRKGSVSGKSDGQPITVLNGSTAEEEVTARVGVWKEGFGVGDVAAEIGSYARTTAQTAGANQGTNATLMAMAAADQLTAIAEGMEIEMLSDNDSQPDRGPNNGSRFRGAGKWLQTTAQNDQPVPEAVRTPTAQIYAGTLANFTEEAFLTMLKARWKANGTKCNLFGVFAADLQERVDTYNCRVADVASYTQIRRTNNNQSDTVETGITFFKTQWGMCEFHPNYFMPSDQRGYLFEMDMVKAHPFGRGTWDEPLGNDGGGDKRVLKAMNLWHPGDPRAHCKIQPSTETLITTLQ